MRTRLYLVSAAIAVALLAIPTALARPTQDAARSADPGITSKTITLGGTFPLSGAASSYAPIPFGMRAYFSYVNARRGQDGKRGVNGRQIIWKFYDDAYNPAQGVQLQRQLVEQDKVFAIVGTLGTEVNIPVREYLNQAKVPHLYVSTGASTFGTESARYPWTIGWQPDYQAEGAIYGRQIRASEPNAKIAILYQNDDYGLDYINGLTNGLGPRASQIVARQGFEVTAASVASQLAALKASGADTLMIFATPAKTIQAYAILARLTWKPIIYVNSVSATDAFMTLAIANAGAQYVNGSISTAYAKDPANPAWDNDASIKLYKQIMAKYLPDRKATDGLYLYGVAKAYTMVQTLYAAGKNPTRASLMRAARNLNFKTNPFLLPGVVTKTSGNDQFPLSHMTLQRFTDGKWQPFGKLINGRGK
jgi:branched-chain amino acid transport system substrate-binding protein